MTSPLIDGLKLMVIGMGMVFLFLCVMIVWMFISSKLSARFSHLLPEPAAVAVKPAQQPASSAATSNNTLLAVISAAIHRYQTEHKKG